MPVMRTIDIPVAPTDVAERKFSVTTEESYEGELLFFHLIVPKNGDTPYRTSTFSLQEVNDHLPVRFLWHWTRQTWDGYVYSNEWNREHRHWFSGRLRLEGEEVAKGAGGIKAVYLDYSGD